MTIRKKGKTADELPQAPCFILAVAQGHPTLPLLNRQEFVLVYASHARAEEEARELWRKDLLSACVRIALVDWDDLLRRLPMKKDVILEYASDDDLRLPNAA